MAHTRRVEGRRAPPSSAQPGKSTREKHALPGRVRNAPRTPEDAFERLDRDRNGLLTWSDFADGRRRPGRLEAIPGDRNRDAALTLSEFRRFVRDGVEREKFERFSSGKGRGATVSHQGIYEVRPGANATYRSDASGLVLGRLQGGDRFIASHQRGRWIYGHIAGRPEKNGWILLNTERALRRSEPRNEAERRALNAPPSRAIRMVRENGVARGPDGKPSNGFVTVDEKRFSAIRANLESRFEVPASRRLLYTTPVPALRDTPVYRHYPPRKGQEVLNSKGKPYVIPAGSKVNFRYTPDGRHAIVLVEVDRKSQSGLWAVVELRNLDIDRRRVPGARRPSIPIT